MSPITLLAGVKLSVEKEHGKCFALECITILISGVVYEPFI